MNNRREFLRRAGTSTALLPFLQVLGRGQEAAGKPRQRIIFFFSPNGTVPENFWPQGTGADFKLGSILAPLEPWRSKMLTLKGLANKVRGDGDGHMRGMSCLLTGIELFPGNIQGGGETPAGWASGPSIDQELKNFLQKSEATRTRFGSLELGVGVPNRADPWTRWTYAGANQPLTPMSDAYEVFEKLYGQMKDRESLGSVLDEVTEDLSRVSKTVGAEDRALIEKHVTFVREMETGLQQAAAVKLASPPPVLEQGVGADNDEIPKQMAMQTDLLVNALANDMAHVATLQFTNSVGQSRFRWIGIDEPHHSLSHDPDHNKVSVEKLTKINTWLAEQIAVLARKLEATPEPGGSGSMLDHTTILWTNELGKGNSHTHEDIPFMLLGGGLGFKTGRALQHDGQPHNRLWLALAHAVGHNIPVFGNKELSAAGPLTLG